MTLFDLHDKHLCTERLPSLHGARWATNEVCAVMRVNYHLLPINHPHTLLK